ncbi:glycoside hydrolase family 5 protein [Formosa sp. 3Alg 14/1]|uniref:glycoside hydrolase family 5 protein n=1 Tax=Formosa sp. 3Alg 14/1 TaxID=3382190 RepID=UPI0039BEAD40
MLRLIYTLLLLLMMVTAQAQNSKPNIGVNLTGYERYWEGKTLNYKDIIDEIDEIHSRGINDVRLPVSFEYQFKQESENRYLRDLRRIAKYIKKKNMTLIVCYFDHTINKETNFTNVNIIKNNWRLISRALRKYSNHVYYELVNEPNLYPEQWDAVVPEIVSEIRAEDQDTKILIGATNYNSIYELSRKKPFPFENIIYVFHFYEPFIFTHQGADWVGNQTKTIGIPYPYNPSKMPNMAPEALGTPGEVNYNDYKDMANKTSLSHKIDIIVNWANQNNVDIWCTEFGAINTIAPEYRCQYFKDIVDIFKSHNIKCYLWEYQGNFGITDNINILDCL